MMIDPVAGKYVRAIFDKAIEGCNTTQIMYYMNEQKIPTPGKYNKENGSVSVWVGTTLQGKKVIVQDTGIGIPKDEVERIFERFTV